MEEILPIREQLTGQSTLFLIRRQLEISRDIAAQQEAIYQAGEPIRQAVGSMAFGNSTPNCRFNFNELGPAVKEASHKRSELYAHLDYMNADLESTYLDTKQRLQAVLTPKEGLPASLWVTKLIEDQNDPNFWRAIQYKRNKTKKQVGYFSEPSPQGLVYTGIDRSGAIHMRTRRDTSEYYGSFVIWPYDINTLQPLVEIGIVYP